MRIDVFTIFPDVVSGYCGASILGRASETGALDVRVHDLRDGADDTRRSVDDSPFGGGAGMVLRPDVVDTAIASVADDRPLIFLSPRGRRLTQQDVRRYAGGPGVILLCGRYEGVDQRVVEARGMEEISIGDYVLSGGELPALVLLDAAARLLPGVMGAAESAAEESFALHLLEYPHFTRPAEWQSRRVPDVLLSGHHAAVAVWRRAEAERVTRERRPDLWDAHTSATRAAPVVSPAGPP
ncbi:MAG: tRNA (guanosine(37)-N1)-methyltransferase TrmD [Acetobacteraceae bacterium]